MAAQFYRQADSLTDWTLLPRCPGYEDSHEQTLLAIEGSFLGNESAPAGISFMHYSNQAKKDRRHIIVRSAPSEHRVLHDMLGHGLCVICCCPLPLEFLCPCNSYVHDHAYSFALETTSPLGARIIVRSCYKCWPKLLVATALVTLDRSGATVTAAIAASGRQLMTWTPDTLPDELADMMNELFLAIQGTLQLEYRVATNGYAYSWEQFQDHYHKDTALGMWNFALRRSIKLKIIHENEVLHKHNYAELLRLQAKTKFAEEGFLAHCSEYCQFIPISLWPWEPLGHRGSGFMSDWAQVCSSIKQSSTFTISATELPLSNADTWAIAYTACAISFPRQFLLERYIHLLMGRPRGRCVALELTRQEAVINSSNGFQNCKGQGTCCYNKDAPRQLMPHYRIALVSSEFCTAWQMTGLCYEELSQLALATSTPRGAQLLLRLLIKQHGTRCIHAML